MQRILQHPIVKKHGPKVAKFIVSGVCGATVDLSSQWLFVEHAGVPPEYAFVLSASMGATVVFFFNKYITFSDRQQAVGNQIVKFVIVYAPSIGLNFLLSTFFYWIGLPHEIAKALAIGIGAVINYILSATFIFKKKEA